MYSICENRTFAYTYTIKGLWCLRLFLSLTMKAESQGSSMYTQRVSGLQPAVTGETLTTLLDYKPLYTALSHTRLTGQTSLQWKKSPLYIPSSLCELA